mgnify:CR=1 FL=1
MGSGMDGATHNPDADGNPNVFELERNDDGKLWLNNDWTKPDNRWNLDNRLSFRLRYFLPFSPRSGGAEFLVSCPCHPPSILPISSMGTDSEAYFLVSNDLLSQRTSSRSFIVSNLRIAIRRYGSFSCFGKNAAAETISMTSTKSMSTFAPTVY